MSRGRSIPATGRGQLLPALQAMSCLTNLSSWTGMLLSKISRRRFCDLPEARNWKARSCTVSGGQIGQQEKTEFRTGRAKEGAEIHDKTAGAYGPILYRDYFNYHNKKCRHRLNSTQTTYKSIGSLCSPGAPFLCLSELDPEGHRKIIRGFSSKISVCSGSFPLNHFCVSGMESNQVSFF